MLGGLDAGGVYTDGHFYWDDLDSSDAGIKDFQVIVAEGDRPYRDTAKVADAMRAASGARFEHGERP